MNSLKNLYKTTLIFLCSVCFCVPVQFAAAQSAVSDIVSAKYAGTSSACWGCHDPRIFQDDDGTYYVYSTGWANGVEIRSSSDLVNWKKESGSPFNDTSYTSKVYGHMRWDDDLLKWVGYAENNRKTHSAAYGATTYSTSIQPNSWAPTVIKQNGKYYLFHGIINDCLISSESDGVGKEYLNPAACITLAISNSPTGPFIPAVQYDGTTYANASLVRYVWTNDPATLKSDKAVGYAGCYNEAGGSWDNGFGAIDPEIVMDIATGKLQQFTIGTNTCYAMTYGSWKGGIALVYVDAQTLKPVCTVAGTSSYNNKQYAVGDEMDAPADSIKGNEGRRIAGGHGAAYEGAQVIYNSTTGYYYLFVSMGDLTYEYRVGVGRSKTVDGLYVDAGGASMNFEKSGAASSYHEYGSKIIGAFCLKNEYGWRCPGGESIFRDKNGKILFTVHSRTTFEPTYHFVLQVRQMFFNGDGWPVLNQNEYYNDYTGITSHGTEELCALKAEDVVGTYEVILTERGSNTGTFESKDGPRTFNLADENEKNSATMKIESGGTVSGAYKGTWTLGADGYSITLTLKRKGTFKGVVLNAVDWAKKGSESRRVITFTALDYSETHADSASGEYLFGNKSR